MKNSFNFTLVKPAKNMGGDRYVTTINGKDWTVYFPQELTRPSGRPAEDLTIVVHVGGINPDREEAK
jgi:hypothetical protein